VLGTGPNHGYGIATRLHQLSDDALRVEEGSLYRHSIVWKNKA